VTFPDPFRYDVDPTLIAVVVVTSEISRPWSPDVAVVAGSTAAPASSDRWTVSVDPLTICVAAAPTTAVSPAADVSGAAAAAPAGL